MSTPKHPLKLELAGPIVCTIEARETVEPPCILLCLDRFFQGDWGNIDPEDAAMNNEAADAANGSRIHASYKCGDLDLWIIADGYGHAHLGPDYCHVTVLLPSDY